MALENVELISNDDLSVDMKVIYSRLEEGIPYKKNEKIIIKIPAQRRLSCYERSNLNK